MMKGNNLLIHHHQQQQQQEENMSNLTSASGEASVSSGNRNDSQQYFAPPPPQSQPPKKKRNLPGNPDPDAEVMALSPKTLMATNRFVCEICNKGFQRDQNLQLHRRGHNLPWKLKQRTNKEVRKKVYVCPETSCVHHDPSRALGDLTGIKKHFCRKHGEKKWKCDKCSKRYAVQSDWKAHSKTCGTREYRCDCGTLFSRRDSFITHRAFCDALAEESARAITAPPPNPVVLLNNSSCSTPHNNNNSNINLQIPQFNAHQDHLHAFSLKKEQPSFTTTPLRPDLPPWLAAGPPPRHPIDHSTSSSSILTHHQDLSQNPNPNSLGPTLPHFQAPLSPHMSATALLQKAAQMGATMSSKTTGLVRPHHHHHHNQQQQEQAHVSVDSSNNNANATGFGLNLSSRDELASGGPFVHSHHHGLISFGNKAATFGLPSGSTTAGTTNGALLQEMMNSLSSSPGFQETTASFEDAFASGVLNSKKDANFHDSLPKATTNDNGGGGGGVGGEGLTRDFLGLRAFSHSDILSMAGFGNCMNTPPSHEQHNQSQKTWQG
ncbi:hypothetical protein JCGZ_24760 [Jatropha curcas]|uniref:C2H2-type domain-containing protein n=1 Tax=Jatropha curcas TaxID=180498 RepID=A0A067KX53_JATCU|nr:protein indeterminate-domain 11 [Jatropha curcas]KDP40761.1 hypothetical protein JCGZ_24760 [Jatropha curcas]